MNAEMKPEYKQTEAGVLPSDWEAKKLGELASFRTGPFGSALHKSDYTNDGIPVVNPMHILDGRIAPTASMTITEEAAISLEDFRLKPGEVIIGRRGDMGRCAVVSERERGWLCGTGSMIVRPSVSADAHFLQRVLSSPSIIKAIEGSSVGSTMINLNQGTLSNLVVQTPPIEEQRAVAATLSDIDDLISGLNQLIKKKRDIQQATMHQLFTGQRRLPGFGGEWEETCLGRVVERFIGGGTPSRHVPEYWDGDISWVTVKDFATFTPWASQERITFEGLKNSASSLIPAGTLITSTRMALGKAVIYQVDVAINQDLKALLIKPSLHAHFLYYWFRFKEKSIDELGSGSTVKGLSLADLRSISLQLPNIEEQHAIANILSDMDTELAALEARREKALQLNQGMMQELLTGRIRLV